MQIKRWSAFQGLERMEEKGQKRKGINEPAAEESFSDMVLRKQKSGERITAADLKKKIEEDKKWADKKAKEEKDWRNMSDKEWDRLLRRVDGEVDAVKEQIRELAEKQEEAAKRAAGNVSADQRATAASQAALMVAASGFAGETLAERKGGRET